MAIKLKVHKGYEAIGIGFSGFSEGFRAQRTRALSLGQHKSTSPNTPHVQTCCNPGVEIVLGMFLRVLTVVKKGLQSTPPL